MEVFLCIMCYLKGILQPMAFGDAYLIVIVLALVASLSIYFQKNKAPLFLRLFPLFLFTTLGVEITGTIMSYRGSNNHVLYNIFTASEFVFYFWMFSQIIHNVSVKKILHSLLWLYPLAFLINKSFIQTGPQFHSYTSSLGSILVALCAIYYFYELFQTSKPINLLHEPAFWIVSGLLFFYCCAFPLFAFANYIYNPSGTVVRHLGSLFSLTNILLYSSFAMAFLCSFKKFSS